MSREITGYNKNLSELRSSGYEVADGEPDIRGWAVRTVQNQEIGKVKELLFDTSSLKVRYVIVNLNGKPLNLISRDLLIPIGLAELHQQDRMVVFPEITAGHFASLPEYKKGNVTIQCERDIRAVFAPSRGIVYKDEDYYDPEEFYSDEYFDEERMNKVRSKQLDDRSASEINPGSKHYRERIVPTDRSKATGTSYPAKNPTGGTGSDKPVQEGSSAPFQEGAIEIKEHAEVPVVSKETRVVEEVSIGKEVTERDEIVKDTVRKTEVDVERFDKDDLSKK